MPLMLCVCLSMPGQIPVSASVTDSPAQQMSPVGVSELPAVKMTTTVTGAPTTLGTGDLVEVRVFGVPDLTQRVRVDSEGKIHLLLIGDIEVGGKSVEWARNSISEKMVEGHFVKNPNVEFLVVEYAGQMAYITGEVNRPGAYPLLRSHRLADLLAISGGLTARAGTDVMIAHSGDEKNLVRVDLKDKDRERANPMIEPGDSIDVGLAGIVYVLGNVGHPGGFLLDRRATLSFTEALALAAGPSLTGSNTKAVLIHSAQPDAQPIAVNLKNILKARSPDIPLQAGDIVWVGDSATRNFGRLLIESAFSAASTAAVYAAYTK